jgi:beta-xylosidase/predicted  nucleic acid-binding Zn-ribbon protein
MIMMLSHSLKITITARAVIVILMIFIGLTSHGQMATNPVLYTDVPDPDFVRVGDTYYMSSTTMHFNPGVPIMKSKDLVNWELVSYCYPIMANTDGLNLTNGKDAYSGGTWASSLTHYKGTFYVSSFSYSTGKTYIYKTANIETGPWTTITLNKVYHDHSLFFDDDGKVYFAYGHDDIMLTEMKPDLTGEQPGGVNKILINKASSVAGSNFILTAEGTRLQKINGMYYVSNICWPSGKGRTQILHRSSTLTGTYSGRVVLQSSIGSAQGEYIDTPDGKWYAIFFHDHGALGRIPDLIPVTWTNGWPTVGVNGQVPATLDIPKGAGTLKAIIDSDEFSSAPPLKLQWQWNHNPNNDYWSLTQRPGYLRLTNERTDANVLRTTNTLTQRSFGPQSSGYISVDVSGMKDGDYAGLIALQHKYGFVGVKMSGTSKSIVVMNGTGISGNSTEIASVPLNQNMVYLRVDFDFRNRVDDAFFYYSLNGTTWQSIGSKLDIVFDLKHFVGYRFGLFTYATKSSGGYADFDFFRVGASIAEASSVGPSIAFTSPANGSAIAAGTDISLAVTASSPNGGINNVKFYNGTTLLHTDNSAPYSYAWTNAPVGTHTIRAVATDNQGKTVESQITIRVNVSQGPYNGTWHAIPGTIQLENYDVGGNGFAYMDDSPGSSVTPIVNFRTDEDVDIENCTDVGGGYNIGFATAGEWLEYSVDVEKPGTYDLDLRVAADGTGRTVSVSMDGVNIASNVAIPNTGGWQTWQSTTVKNIDLKAGKQILRVTIGATDYVNLNYVTFKLIKELKQEPFHGTAHTIPGRIQAEDYDLGGEGLAFHEANAEANEGGADYRTDEVDIEETQDTDGAYNIAYIMQGEWLEYTVNVTSDGVYDLDLRMAADGDDKILHIEMDGKDVSGAINVPNTGGWQTWQTVTVNGINLTAGEHIMRIAFDASYMNLNYVEFRDVITGLLTEATGFRIYPNPFENSSTLEYPGFSKYSISSTTGLVLETSICEDSCIVGKDLSTGIYFVNIESNGLVKTIKLIKK